MTTSDHPFASSAAAANGSQPPSQARLALDNLLRRELRVSDPNDAKAVATALMERYKNDPKTRAIQSEAQGLPFSTAPLTTTPVAVVSTTSDGEFSQAAEDVERNLQELTTNSLLTQVLPELGGWASAIRSLMEEGINSARFALDVKQRDKTFGIRRSLGDYARMARLVGALSPSVNVIYRKLAQSLDAISSVLLVKMGEALASGNHQGGRFIMQAPYGELQARRDAVINALRNLVGCTTQVIDPNAWPRGLDAYGDLYRELESQGQSDLRALLDEAELARIMDSLIQRAARGQTEGLRALGATAQLDLQRFQRLCYIGQSVVDPESPPLTTFLKALQLFADAFSTSGGIKLLHIARPPILFYGLYGSSGSSEGAKILTNLIVNRGFLATTLDCLAGCCEQNKGKIKSLMVLDKILYDIDRAIDLHALGKDSLGKAERRASAYAYVIQAVLNLHDKQSGGLLNQFLVSDGGNTGRGNEATQLRTLLETIRDGLNVSTATDEDLAEYKDALPSQTDMGGELIPLSTTSQNLAGISLVMDISKILQGTIKLGNGNATIEVSVSDDLYNLEAKALTVDPLKDKEQYRLDFYHTLLNSVRMTHQEVCIQREIEGQWQGLVSALASGCYADTIFDDIEKITREACDTVTTEECSSLELKLPVDVATALDQQTNNSNTKGGGRFPRPSLFST